HLLCFSLFVFSSKPKFVRSSRLPLQHRSTAKAKVQQFAIPRLHPRSFCDVGEAQALSSEFEVEDAGSSQDVTAPHCTSPESPSLLSSDGVLFKKKRR
ncbi:hypothetical protein V2J09_004250, partial [Rumex salicifolius]